MGCVDRTSPSISLFPLFSFAFFAPLFWAEIGKRVFDAVPHGHWNAPKDNKFAKNHSRAILNTL
jgi:hypothetical protein